MKKGILSLLLVAITSSVFSQKAETRADFDASFVHVVYFWLKEPNNQEHRKHFETSLNTFLKNSAYTQTNFIGTPPKAIRDVVDDSFTYNLIVTFDSALAQEKYQDEEAHLKFIAECKDLWQKVVVYDAIGQ